MLLFTENNAFGAGLGKRHVGFFVFVFVGFFCFVLFFWESVGGWRYQRI